MQNKIFDCKHFFLLTKLKKYFITSKTPLYAISDDSIFVKACNRVLITSNGFTTNADVEPATQPHKNDHQKTASPISIENSLLNVNKQFIFLMQTQNQNFF